MQKLTHDLRSLLADDPQVRAIFGDLGASRASVSEQAEMLSKTGELLLKRLVLEILKIIPEEAKPRLDELLFAGDGDAMREFLSDHVGDVDAFIHATIKKEIEAIKSALQANR